MIKYCCHKYEELTALEIYEIMRLRSQVFVVEQNCIYQDLDRKDIKAHHILAKERSKIIGYSRILKKGESYEDFSSIGRVVVKKEKRKKNIGRELMEFTIKTCFELYPNNNIKISAQTYLKRFYLERGFKYKGEDYLEDGIPHCSMYYEKMI